MEKSPSAASETHPGAEPLVLGRDQRTDGRGLRAVPPPGESLPWPGGWELPPGAIGRKLLTLLLPAGSSPRSAWSSFFPAPGP